MRNVRPAVLVASSLFIAGCTLFDHAYRPPHAPKSEAANVRFPWGTPRERVVLSGTWLRAVTMAMDDFLPAEAAERVKPGSEEAACLARRNSWYLEAFTWSPVEASDAGDGGAAEVGDGESSGESDGGGEDGFAQPGMLQAPSIIYVSISLRPDACDFGGSVLLDAGALYAIDTVNWRILAVHH
jgi:hypothetical protein